MPDPSTAAEGTPAAQTQQQEPESSNTQAQPQQAPAPADAPVQLDVDPDLTSDGGDSAYGDEIASLTTSLASAVTDFEFENGRRYHAFQKGSYIMPNDDSESDRLDMHHHLATLLLDGKLHVAPIKPDVQRILDVATGTGIWAIQMGDDYPSATVTGVDLSPTQPNMVPPNVHFLVDDIEQPWIYSAPFDLIHFRFLAASILDWPKLIQQAYDNTKPGGWIELKDWDMNLVSTDNSLPEDSKLLKHHQLLITACEKLGRIPSPGSHLKGWAEKAGYINVHEEALPVPIGLWPKDKKLKDIGAWNCLALLEGLEAISLRAFTTMLGWQASEVQVLLAEVRKELKNPKFHTQYTYYVVYGQKPEEPQQETTN